MTNGLGLYIGALERLGCNKCPELSRFVAGEGASEGSDGSPDSGQDHDRFGHVVLPILWKVLWSGVTFRSAIQMENIGPPLCRGKP